MSFTSARRSRARFAWVMAVAILLAGIAQAAHYHESELAGGSSDVHCLVCLYAAGAAGPPSVVQAVSPGRRYCTDSTSPATVLILSRQPVPYEARGPPLS
jgi:hypothetical protein